MDPRLEYIPAKLMEPASGLKGQWYVYYSVLGTDATGKQVWVRKILKKGINRLKTVTARRAYGRELIQAVNQLLKEDWNPLRSTSEKFIPLTDCLDVYVKQKERFSRRRWQAYKYSADLIKKWLKKESMSYILPEDFTPVLCRRLCNYLLEDKKYKGSTFNDHRKNFIALFNAMMDEEVITKNPFKKISPVRAEVGMNVPFTPKELKKINETLILKNYRLYLFTQFIYFCYIRPIEILRLKVSNINVKDRQIMVYGNQSKNAKQQAVEIPDSFLPIVREMKLEDYPGEYYLFGKNLVPSEKPFSRNTVSKYFKVQVKDEFKLSKEKTLYSFKHTGCCAAYNEGIPMLNIMRQCRHHSISETENYLRSLGLIRNTEFATRMK